MARAAGAGKKRGTSRVRFICFCGPVYRLEWGFAANNDAT
jgi:hypothetical protein